MKVFRSALLILLAAVCIFGLAACGYKAVPSTKEEAATVLTLDGKYEAPYELYRFLFLQKKHALDDGKESYWTGKDKKAAFNEIDKTVKEEICRTYALFSLCDKYGIDPYSDEIEDVIEAEIVKTIEGDGENPGYGKYKNYLAEIKKEFLNDSVYRFYLRYDACEARLAAKLKQDKVITAKEEKVFAYYAGKETVCATWILLPYGQLENYSEAMRESILADAKAADNETFKQMAAQYAITQSAAELAEGVYFGKYEYDLLYKELVDTAFALAEGETSDAFFSGDGLYIVRRLPKSMEYLADESHAEALAEGYMLNVFYRMLWEEENRLAGTVAVTDVYRGLAFDTIKMPED